MSAGSDPHPLREILLTFLRFGFVAYGGPAAHIAMFREEAVDRRKWLTDEQFLDLLGATNLIPGPNSTEMAIHIGYLRAGRAGLIAAGAAFIFPAMLLVMILAWLYVRYGSTPQATWLLYGVKPVVIVIILQALWMLGRKAVKNIPTILAALTAAALFFLNTNLLLALLAGGLVVVLPRLARNLPPHSSVILPLLPLPALQNQDIQVSLQVLFFTFLKIGSVLYGSGYVLLAFLESDFVHRLGWLSNQQIIDAVAIGQVTPGPVFTTATFIGYILGGLPGALLSTLGIFLPSFFLVAMSNPVIPRLRESAIASALLDGVNAAAMGLMAVVTFRLGRSALVDLPSLAAFLLAAVLLYRFKVSTTWLILGGAVFGFLVSIC